MEAPTSRETVLLCVNAALGKQAKDILILRVKEVASFTDYFIICSGRSDRQVQAIAHGISEELKKNGIRPLGVEGTALGTWILVDLGDVIVHIFHEPVRAFYDIERLWSDVPTMSVDENLETLLQLDSAV
ncbi:MAG: ribosome silencing factor [Deltaproteobacteria bacterium]|nr:ribosome silencing factor [Deltaproteobacteria bacterium]